MSRYLQLINLIKQKCDLSWATPSQQEIISLLTSCYSSHKVINIFGDPGSGKTFLGWLLHKNRFGSYISEPNEIGMPIRNHRVIIDNAPTDRFQARSLRSHLQESNYKQFIFITALPVDDDMLKLHLHLTKDDKAKFKQNLYLYCGFQLIHDEQRINLNNLLIANLKGDGY